MKKIIFIKSLLFLTLLPSLVFGQATGKIIANRSSGGTISVDTINAGSLFNLHQTTASQTITVPSPGSTKTIDVVNIGSVDVTLSPGGTLSPAPAGNSRAQLRWTGAVWAVTVGSSGGTDTSAIHKTGNETIRSGIKTFVISPSVPTPTLTVDAANKGYVDTKDGAKQDTGTAVLRNGTRAMTGNLDLGGNNAIDVNLVKVNDAGGLYNTSNNAHINLEADGHIDFTATGINATTVPYLDASKNLVSSTVTPTELGYVHNVTSSIQTQLNSISGNGDSTLTLKKSNNLNDLANKSTARTNLGVPAGSGTSTGTNTGDTPFKNVNRVSIAGTGNVTLENVYNVMNYGFDSTGLVDNTSAMNSLVSLVITGSTIYFPCGTYLFNSGITINKVLNIKGEGPSSKIQTSSTTINLFNFEGTNWAGHLSGIYIHDIYIRNNAVATVSAGSGIRMSFVNSAKIERCWVSGFWNNIQLSNTFEMSIDKCFIQSYVNAAIETINLDVTTVNLPDFGDSHISGCTFVPEERAASYSIYQKNNSGWRIIDNKFNQGAHQATIHYNLTSSTSTNCCSDLLIEANSFENMARQAIYLDHGTGGYSNVSITGNQFALGNSSYNTIELGSIANVSITGNVFAGQTINSAINLTNCSNVNINNTYSGYNTPVTTSGTTLNHSGTLNSVFVVPDLPSIGTNIQPTSIQSRIGGVAQMQSGCSFSATYSGSSNVSSGRQHYWFDNTGAGYRGGIDQNGTFWIGASNSVFGLSATQAGVVTTKAIITSYIAKTANYTAISTDETIECTANSFTITLPTAVGITGKSYEIVNSGAGTITIATTSSQTFVNVTATPTTLTLATAAAKAIKVRSNGANWMQIN